MNKYIIVSVIKAMGVKVVINLNLYGYRGKNGLHAAQLVIPKEFVLEKEIVMENWLNAESLKKSVSLNVELLNSKIYHY
jgi:hypothetical protein